MDAERLRRMQEIFEAVDGLPEEERGPLLDRLCAGDADLRQRVLALLRHAEEGTDDAFRPPLEAAGLDDPDEGPESDAFGRYRLVRRLGEGGFGTVWEAEQTEPVRRFVALKMLKPGMDTRRILARFRSERQTLAALDHPGIAKVLDAGQTERGRPYFVMELIDGPPIDRFCDDRRLSIEARLGLFLQVCAALQHAHMKGIIHRDLKPSNVLVTQGGPGDEALARVIDFGIARVVVSGERSESLVTQEGQYLGTPAYMSPEQAVGDPAAIDVRTDVYGLGAILYRLLCGAAPVDETKLRTISFAEMQRLILEKDPVRPSARCLQHEDPGAVAAARSTDAFRLSRRLRGDLDWIILRALERDPRRRYASVGDLAGDIRAHLENRPVSAGPPSTGYVLGKFVRRHRAGVAAGVAVGAALLIGIAGTTAGLVRALRAERQAVALADAEAEQRAVAERRFDQVRELASTLMFGIHDAVAELPGSLEARRLLVDTGLKYADTLAAEAGDDPRLLRDLGDAYRRLSQIQGRPGAANLGDADAALATQLRAIDIWNRLIETGAADALHDRAAAERDAGNLLRTLGRLPEAAEFYQRAIETHRRIVETQGDSPLAQEAIAHASAGLARIQSALGQHREAIESLRVFERYCSECVAAEPDHTGHRTNLAVVRAEMARPYNALGRHDEARRLLEGAVADIAALQQADPDNPRLLRTRLALTRDLGSTIDRTGAHEEALPFFRQALGLSRRIAEADPNDRQAAREVAACLQSVGLALNRMGRPAEAIEHLVPAVEAAERLSAENPDVIAWRRDVMIGLRELGQARLELAEAAEGLALLRRSLAVADELLLRSPADVVLREDAAVARLIVARALAELHPGEAADAARLAREAESLLRDGRDEASLTPRDRDVLGQIAELLARLP